MIYKIFHWGVCFFVIIAGFIFLPSCSQKQSPIVYVPQVCTFEMPNRPNNTSDPYLNMVEILKYTEAIEITLKACRGE